MKHLPVSVLLAAAVLAVACGKPESPAGKPPAAAESAKKLAESAPAAPDAAPTDAKSLITDDKVARYIVYQREMNTVAGLVMGAATQAYGASGGDQKKFEKEMSKDERTKKIADTEASALAKSGLTRAEVMAMVQVIAPYTPGATMGDDEMKKKARADFSAKYGPEVLAVLERHLPELSKLQDEMLGALATKKN